MLVIGSTCPTLALRSSGSKPAAHLDSAPTAACLSQLFGKIFKN